MTQIKWKAEASGIAKHEATAGSIGGGEIGDAEVLLSQKKDKVTVTVNGKPVLEYKDDDGDVTKVKILKGGEQALAEAFDKLRDL